MKWLNLDLCCELSVSAEGAKVFLNIDAIRGVDVVSGRCAVVIRTSQNGMLNNARNKV